VINEKEEIEAQNHVHKKIKNNVLLYAILPHLLG
jgi:hypothetical protein